MRAALGHPAGLMAAYAVVFLNYCYPFLRTGSALINVLVFLSAQALPLVATCRAVTRLQGEVRALVLLVSVPATVFAGLAAASSMACAKWIAENGRDVSFERRTSLDTSHGHLVAYRTNGGATTDFGIVIRQECGILPGLYLVRELVNQYAADEVHLSSSSGEFQADFPERSSRAAFTLELKPWPLICPFG